MLVNEDITSTPELLPDRLEFSMLLAVVSITALPLTNTPTSRPANTLWVTRRLPTLPSTWIPKPVFWAASSSVTVTLSTTTLVRVEADPSIRMPTSLRPETRLPLATTVRPAPLPVRFTLLVLMVSTVEDAVAALVEASSVPLKEAEPARVGRLLLMTRLLTTRLPKLIEVAALR